MAARRTVAVLGGSFDPPHVGHVLLAAWALTAGGVDEVLVVPTFGHAFGKKSVPFDHRVRMVELAFAHLAPVRVSRIEETLPVPSYTVRTLEAIAAAHPDVALRLLCGADVLGDLDKWKEPDRLLALAPLLACGRAGHARTAGGRSVSTLGPDLPAVSSTEIRAALRGGVSVAGLVPDAVREHVDAHGLYRPERERRGYHPAVMNLPERTLEMLRGLPGVTEDVKWGADLCYSVGSKMFAVFGMAPYPGSEHDEPGGSFKVRDEEFDDLSSRPGLRPAPYLAKHKWIAFDGWRVMPIAELEARLRTSYELVKAGLPKKRQLALAVGGSGPPAPAKRAPAAKRPEKGAPAAKRPEKGAPAAKRPEKRAPAVKKPVKRAPERAAKKPAKQPAKKGRANTRRR